MAAFGRLQIEARQCLVGRRAVSNHEDWQALIACTQQCDDRGTGPRKIHILHTQYVPQSRVEAEHALERGAGRAIAGALRAVMEVRLEQK